MHSADGTHQHLNFQEYVPTGWPAGVPRGGRTATPFDTPFDRTKATKYRDERVKDIMNRTASMEVALSNGATVDFRSLTAQQIRRNTEMLTPLIRPYGCGPVAPADWLVLRTYQRIVEMRDEMRMDEQGLCIGDRTFKRRYQQAEADIRRFEQHKAEVQKNAEEAGERGLDMSTFGDENHAPNPRLRSPANAVRWAFKYLTDKHWHRYLFPFGCFFYDRVGATDPSWKGWVDSLVPCKANPALRINPYSVTAADILYLCNTTGYLERFTFIIGVILWAKQRGCNLLIHTAAKTSADYRTFVTLEKHLHLFGSIYLHRRVLESNKIDVGGNWTETLEMLNRLENECYTEFGLSEVRVALRRDLDNMTVERVKSNVSTLQSVFPKCARIAESRRP